MRNSELKNAGSFLKPGVFLLVFLVALDQLGKFFVPSVFKNYHFAFSLPLPVWCIYTIYGILLAAIFFYLANNFVRLNGILLLAWVLILAGAFSNIGERLVLGYVRDWIYITVFHLTGIYNLADGYILLGIIILLFYNDRKNI